MCIKVVFTMCGVVYGGKYYCKHGRTISKACLSEIFNTPKTARNSQKVDLY